MPRGRKPKLDFEQFHRVITEKEKTDRMFAEEFGCTHFLINRIRNGKAKGYPNYQTNVVNHPKEQAPVEIHDLFNIEEPSN